MAKLTPHQRALIKKRSKFHEPGPDELDDELNIVPFLDITINLIVFLLMLLTTIGFYSQVEASLPSYSRGGVGRRATDTESLNLNVTVVTAGVIIAGSNGKLAPGCETVVGANAGNVITVPKVGGEYDWPALRRCVIGLKARYADEYKVTVSADPMVPYSALLAAMDAVRERDATGDEPPCCRAEQCTDNVRRPGVECCRVHSTERCLFDEVQLSAGVR